MGVCNTQSKKEERIEYLLLQVEKASLQRRL